MPEYSDEELAKKLQEGDHAALSALMDRYTAKLLRYGRRFLASQDDINDIVQDVFISVYQNIKGFDASQRFSPWIYRIAHNAYVDSLRRRSKEPLALGDLDLDRLLPHPWYEDPDEGEKEREEMRVLVEKGLDRLPAGYREIIDLYYFENFSYKEIADILHVPMGTVGIRLSRAKQALKKLIPPQDL